MSKQWVKVYDLSTDYEAISMVQDATLNTKDFGILPEVALYGSSKWWDAINDGRITTYKIEGVISRLFMSGHNDWPQFEIDSRGVKTQWTRLGENELYKEGREITLDYVIQKLRKQWEGAPEQKEILRIFIKKNEEAL